MILKISTLHSFSKLVDANWPTGGRNLDWLKRIILKYVYLKKKKTQDVSNKTES